MRFLGARCLTMALQAKERRKPPRRREAHAAGKWHSKNSNLGLLAAPRSVSRRRGKGATQHPARHARALRPDYHGSGCQ